LGKVGFLGGKWGMVDNLKGRKEGEMGPGE
jgi:hypothetical protein